MTDVQWSRCLVALLFLTLALTARAWPMMDSSEDSGGVPQTAMSPADTKDGNRLTKEAQDFIDHRIMEETDKSAPRQFIGQETILNFVLTDLESQPEDRRPFLRYLTLANLYNIMAIDGPVDSDARMEMYRAAVTKLVNCLSTSPRITVPITVDFSRTLFRLDLRDYEMTPKTWESIVNRYPYGIVGASPRLENRIQTITQSRQACLRADWFVFATSQPPLYNDILGLPSTERELERKLGLNTLADLGAFRVIRAAILNSGVSFSNRVIERHEIGSYSGGYWKSYDFYRDHSTERQNVSLAPLGPIEAGLTQDPKHAFESDGSEIMFQLPNGLIGGYLVKANGNHLDRASLEILQDKTHTARDDSAVVNGISCIVCHSDGFKMPAVQSPTTIGAKLDNSSERTAVERLYPESSLLQATINADNSRFQKALSEASPGYTGEEPVHVLYRRFLEDIIAVQLGTEFWKNEENITDVFDKGTDPTVHILASKMKSGLPLARTALERTFANAVHVLGFQPMSFAPANYEEFGGVEATIGENQAPLKAPPKTATSDQPDEATIRVPGGGTVTVIMSKLTYHIGESLGFTLKCDTDCFVKITQLGADGSATQLVPNGYNNINRLRAGERRIFPGRSTDGTKELSFTTTPPAGAETLLVFVSRSQFRDDVTAPSSKQQPFRGYTRGALIGNRGAILIQAGTSDSLPNESKVVAGQVGYQLVE